MSVKQNLSFDSNTASSLAKHNCAKCYGRGQHFFQQSTRIPGKFIDRNIYCDCVIKQLERKVKLDGE